MTDGTKHGHYSQAPLTTERTSSSTSTLIPIQRQRQQNSILDEEPIPVSDTKDEVKMGVGKSLSQDNLHQDPIDIVAIPPMKPTNPNAAKEQISVPILVIASPQEDSSPTEEQPNKQLTSHGSAVTKQKVRLSVTNGETGSSSELSSEDDDDEKRELAIKNLPWELKFEEIHSALVSFPTHAFFSMKINIWLLFFKSQSIV